MSALNNPSRPTPGKAVLITGTATGQGWAAVAEAPLATGKLRPPRRRARQDHTP